MKDMGVHFVQKSDLSMVVHFSLFSINLKDTRKETQCKITDIVSSSSSKHAQLSVDYNQHVDGAQKVIVVYRKSVTIIALEFFLDIYKYLMPVVKESQQTVKGSTSEEDKKRLREKSEEKKELAKTEIEKKRQQIRFDLRLSVEDPEVILIETAEQQNPRSLVARTGMTLHLNIEEETMKIQASLNKIELFKCNFEQKVHYIKPHCYK